jgi:DNA-directed RNA polymerase subunit RPC12/RpoP
MSSDRLTCSHCSTSFSKKSNLKRHVEEKHEAGPSDRKYVCSDCGSSYSRKRTLNEHISETHAAQTPTSNGNFHCDLCEDKAFKKAESLSQHYLIVRKAIIQYLSSMYIMLL